MEKRHSWGCFLFLAAFACYLHGAYPSVSVGDSGEFVTAAHTLGIPHAPGYPAYVLLGKMVDRLIPWANVGYRLNLFSALSGALAVVLLFFIGLELSFSYTVSLFAALVFLLGPAQSLNAQASEVFALHALFCAAVLWAALAEQWLLAVFLLGVGLANHQTLLLLLPAVTLAYFARPSQVRVALPELGVAFLGGMTVYAFLYLRASQAPVMNSGDPDTLQRFWRVLSRADYGSLTLALGETPARSIPTALQQLVRFLEGLSRQMTWVGVGSGAIAAVIWMRRQFVPALLLWTAFLFIGPVFFLLGNLPFDAQSNGLLERFYIVPSLCWILLLAGGVQLATTRFRWIGAAAFLLPLFLLIQQGNALSCRGDLRAYAYGRNNLRTLPIRSMLIMDGGDDTFYTLAYLTHVENRRTDIELHDRGGVVFPGLYGDDFRSLTRMEKEDRRQHVEHALLATRTLYYSTMNTEILQGAQLLQEGILYCATSSDGMTPFDPWFLYDLRGVAPWQSSSRFLSQDYRTRALLPFYAYQRSVQAARGGRWSEALGYASAAQAVGPDVVWLIPNLVHNAYLWGRTNFEAGRYVLAAEIFHRITNWDPTSSTAWSNLGAIEEKRQHIEAAIANYQKAIELEPGSEGAHYNLAVAYWKLSNWEKVVLELQRVMSINPNNNAARSFLVQAQARASEVHR